MRPYTTQSWPTTKASDRVDSLLYGLLSCWRLCRNLSSALLCFVALGVLALYVVPFVLGLRAVASRSATTAWTFVCCL